MSPCVIAGKLFPGSGDTKCQTCVYPPAPSDSYKKTPTLPGSGPPGGSVSSIVNRISALPSASKSIPAITLCAPRTEKSEKLASP